jgi:hypothetical protein
MRIDTVIASLHMADPDHNSNYHERYVALEMAHKAMDEQGLSYASLGFSQEEAERIEQQFSASTGHEQEGSHRTGYKGQWWNPFSWGERQEQASHQAKQQEEYEHKQSSGSGEYSSSDYHSYNDPTSNDYEFQINYEVVEDYQGPVPFWDGYSGE